VIRKLLLIGILLAFAGTAHAQGVDQRTVGAVPEVGVAFPATPSWTSTVWRAAELPGQSERQSLRPDHLVKISSKVSSSSCSLRVTGFP
jgi:hypothetical protein